MNCLTPITLAIGLSLACSHVAMAASEATASAPAASASDANASTVITVPDWVVGDKASFSVERTTDSKNMPPPGGYRAPVSVSMDVEVLSIAAGGEAVHQWRFTVPGGPYGKETIIAKLAISPRGEILRVLNLDEVIAPLRASRLKMLEAFAPSMSEEVRTAQAAALERAMAPETVQRELLDFPSIVYAAGNGQRYRGGDTGATPTKREVFGTGIEVESTRRFRVETSAADKTAVISAIDEVTRESLPQAVAKAVAKSAKGFGGDAARQRRQPAPGSAIAKVLGDMQMSLRTEGRLEVEDQQPWPRLVIERRIVSGVREGRPMEMVVETRLQRTVWGASPGR